MPGFMVEPLSGDLSFGAIVSGLEPGMLDDDVFKGALRTLFTDRGFLLVRGLKGPKAQVKLSAVFGENELHPVRGVAFADAYPELIDIHHKPGVGTVIEVDGEARGAWLPWHFDHSFTDKLNRGGVMRPLILPTQGGETGFIDRIAAYDALPEPLKQRIAGLSAIYKLQLDPCKQRFARNPSLKLLHFSPRTQAMMANADDFPRAIHPLVFERDDGRKVFNLSPWYAVGIEGMENTEGDALLEELIQRITTSTKAYFHRWQAGDMIAWDNWRLLHCAAGIADGEERRLQRTTIAGDYALGRYEAGARARPHAPSAG